MAKVSMDAVLKRRMAATQHASELQASDEAYQQFFHQTTPRPATICELPLDKLVSFFTADIGFKLYPPAQLKAFAQQLAEEGLLVRIIVRPIPGTDTYEILAGHNRVEAARMNGWAKIAAEVVEADDARAITIATVTNLIQRPDISILVRGKAYLALLTAKNRNGQHNISENDVTFGENRQRYNARAVVAEFFGVTEYEIRKTIKLTRLIPELMDILENTPKQLSLSCADLIADYDRDSQTAFIAMCSIHGYRINKATMQYIVRACPPPTAERSDLFAAWREARARAEKKLSLPPKKITFDRKRFAPYLEKLGSDREFENLFLEFLRERVSC